MKKYYSHTLVLAIILVIGLSSCEMKASTPPPTTADMDMQTMEAEAAFIKTANAEKSGSAGSKASGGDEVSGDPLAGKTFTPTVTAEGGEATAVPSSTPIPSPTSTPGPVTSYGVPSSYQIHKGEHPFCLGRRFNINPDDLLAFNGLYRGAVLYPGHTLNIPTNARPFPGERALRSHPASYTVQTNDTFYSIACLFGNIDPRTIADYNGMDVSQSLSVGAVIQIP